MRYMVLTFTIETKARTPGLAVGSQASLLANDPLYFTDVRFIQLKHCIWLTEIKAVRLFCYLVQLPHAQPLPCVSKQPRTSERYPHQLSDLTPYHVWWEQSIFPSFGLLAGMSQPSTAYSLFLAPIGRLYKRCMPLSKDMGVANLAILTACWGWLWACAVHSLHLDF